MSRLHRARTRLRALVTGAVVVPVLAATTVAATAAGPAHAATPGGAPWVVSVGDSYISG